MQDGGIRKYRDMIPNETVHFSLFLHPDQAQNTLSGIQGQEATAIAVI